MAISNKAKTIYLVILILFISAAGLFWMDFIGLVDIQSRINRFKGTPESVVNAKDDEPSLVEREEFEKEKQKLQERIEEIDKREAKIVEKEKNIDSESDKIDEIKKGIDLEKKKLSDDKLKYSGYQKNIKKLSEKISNMPPDESVKIMINWEDPLIIDVLRQMDRDAEELGRQSITSYLITLMPKDKASRIMYLMTQL